MNWLRSLFVKHTVMTKEGTGVILICHHRWKRYTHAFFLPEGSNELIEIRTTEWLERIIREA